jgi:hypothetical protein
MIMFIVEASVWHWHRHEALQEESYTTNIDHKHEDER